MPPGIKIIKVLQIVHFAFGDAPKSLLSIGPIVNTASGL